MFNNTKANSLLVSTPISLENLLGATIAISASIKGGKLTGGGNLGMVVQLLATPDSGALRYYRIAVDTGTFDWTQVGEILKIDSDVVALNLEIGIYNATGKLWLDNLNIQVVAGAMPPSRSSFIAINKCHTDKMYRGMDNK